MFFSAKPAKTCSFDQNGMYTAAGASVFCHRNSIVRFLTESAVTWNGVCSLFLVYRIKKRTVKRYS